MAMKALESGGEIREAVARGKTLVDPLLSWSQEVITGASLYEFYKHITLLL
jgi:hypothetical protein